MNDKTKKLCDNLVTYSRALRRKMVWETDSNAMAILGAFFCISAGVEADVDKYVACKKLFKSKVNIFSEFRGVSETIVITKMMISKDPEEYLDGALKVYKKLRAIHKLWTSPFMVLAAINIYENGGVTRADENIEKLESLYKKVQKEHPWLIDDNDRPFFAILATSGLNEDELMEEMEKCYQANKHLAVLNKEGVHSMAQLMCLSDKSVEEKAEFAKAYMEGMKAAKKKISKNYGLPSLGAMTLLDVPVDELVEKTVEIDNYLKTQKGFKWYSTSPSILRMYDQMVLMIENLGDNNAMKASVVTGSMAMVIVEQILLYIIVMEMVIISSTTSHSSSH